MVAPRKVQIDLVVIERLIGRFSEGPLREVSL